MLLLLLLSAIREPSVLGGCLGCDSLLGSELQHSFEKVDADGVDLGEDDLEWLRGVGAGEDVSIGSVFGELGDVGPLALGWCAHDSEDFDELVFVGCAGEERTAAEHLCHDATCGPYIDACVVCPAS